MSSNKHAFTGLILIFLLFSFSISGQTVQDVAVSVNDSTGNVVSGASVVLTGRNILPRTTTTGIDGIARFRDVQATGDLRITVESSGFGTITRDVKAGEAVTNISLAPGGLSESVTVTATRTQITTDETAAPVSVVDREGIERRAVNTIGDIFRTLPGTSTVNEGAFQVRPRIRGLDSNRVLVLIDGERLNNARTSTAMSGVETGLVDTSQIESVEVVRGSGSVLYGTDALAGTINIITRDTPPRRPDGFRFGAILDTFYSSNENGRRGNLAVNGSGNRFAFRVAQSLERYDNYSTGDLEGRPPNLTPGVGPDGEVLNSQSHGGNTQATARIFINDSNALRLNYGRRRAADIGVPTLVGTFNAFFPFSNRDKFNVRFDSAGLTKNFARLSVSGYYQTQFRNFSNILTVPPAPPFFPGIFQFSETATDTKTAGFDVQTDWIIGKRNYLTAGVSFFSDQNSDRRFIELRSTAISPVLSQDRSRSVPDASLTNFAVFAQNEFRLSPRLRFIGGIRIDRFTTAADPTEGFAIPPTFTQAQLEDLGLSGLTSGLNVTNTAVTGDIGAVFSVTENVIVSGRLGRSFRTPNIFERFFTDFGSVGGFVVGNPDLEPESGVNFDTSVKFRSSKLNASATYFNNFYENFLSTVTALDRNGVPITIPRGTQTPIPVSQTRNTASARIQGVELELEIPIKISLGYLTPYGNFSYLRGDDLTAERPLGFISPVRTNAGVRWQNFAKNYFADYSTRIVQRQDRGTQALGFVTHNIGGGYYFRRERFNFNINLGVSNLFDRFYNEHFVFAPARGRSFTVGTSWEIK